MRLRWLSTLVFRDSLRNYSGFPAIMLPGRIARIPIPLQEDVRKFVGHVPPEPAPGSSKGLQQDDNLDKTSLAITIVRWKE